MILDTHCLPANGAKMISAIPKVSILIPNFNHACFVSDAIESALNQTWSNTEVIVLDNHSTDNSWNVLSGFSRKGVRINRNPVNILNATYRVLSDYLSDAKYFLLLGADDVLMPDFIEKAVGIFEKYPNVGYVHGERSFILPDNTEIELDPFFKMSFICPGEDIMPLYLVTTIAHPAQGVIRRSAFEAIGGYEMEVDHMNADRSLWFYLSAVADYAYIREKSCKIRVNEQTETALTQKNFQHPLLCHMIVNDCLRFAQQFNFPKALRRKSEAYERLSRELCGYAGGSIAHGDFITCERYLHYAEVLNDEITKNDIYQSLLKMCETRYVDEEFLKSINVAHTARKRGYQPPENFYELL